MANPRSKLNPAQALTSTRKRSARKVKQQGGMPPYLWVVLALLLAFGGGGGYAYYNGQQKAKAADAAAAAKKARAEAAAKKRAEEQAKLDAERAAKEAEEAERAAKEAEEAERARREAEEAEESAPREAEEAKNTEPEPEPEPKEEPKPEEPKPAEPTEQAGPYDADLPLVGTASLDKSATAAYEGMVNHLLDTQDFKAFAKAFKKKIPAATKDLLGGDKLNYGLYKQSRNLVNAVDICLMTDVVPEQELRTLFAGKADDPQSGRAFAEWLLRDKSQPLHELLRWFMLEEGQPMNLGASLKTLCEIWKVCPPRERNRYMNLAIACSLVSPAIANSPGQLKKPKAPLLSLPELFTYFREQDAKHKLLADIKKMSVERLLYVVDVRLPRSEFDWVEKNLKYKRANWGDAYSSIRYRMDRAANNVDPYKEYTFAELRQEGGVCRDQAYFCGASSKCKGIPSIYAVGDGDRGPHAWVVLLVDDRTWVQINNYGYTSGRVINPCSCRSMHESVFLSQTKAERADKLAPAGDAMELSYLLARADDVSGSRSAARYITGAFPTLTAAWTNRLRVLETDNENHPVDAAVWKRIDNELTQASRKNAELADLAGQVEDKHLADGKSVGARKSAIERQMRQLKHNVGDTRADVVVDTIEREGKVLAEAKNYRQLQVLYKKQVKDYASRGDIVQQLMSQYMGFLEGADARTWSTVAKDMEKIFEKNIRSGGEDYFKLTKEVEIQKLIATCWENAGNTKKAEKIREEADTRLQEAKSQYKDSN